MYGMYGYGYGYGLDPTITLVLIGVALSLWAQGRVNSTFSRYSRVRSMTGMTGAEAARRLLNAQGIYDVTVQQIAGELTDHYDPRDEDRKPVPVRLRSDFRCGYRCCRPRMRPRDAGQ